MNKDKISGRASLRATTGWIADSRDFRLTAALLLALFAIYQAAYLTLIIRRFPQPLGDSFFLWIQARFLISHPAAEIYDQAILDAVQVANGMDPNDAAPFAYPPTMMIILAPFGLLPYRAAWWSAVGGSLLLYLWATVGRDWRSPVLFAGLVAPTTTLTILAGQTGFLAGALMIGGFRLTARHPVLGGVLLGLLTYKPQLGLLVPVALASARLWSAMAAASATVLALVLVTSTAFGWSVWPTWIVAIYAYSDQFALQGELRHLMPTVWANLMQLGFTPQAARLGQWLGALSTSAVVWVCFRHGATPLAIAALLVGTFLATPHALVYDMPMLTTAVLWLVAERCRSGGLFPLGEAVILFLAMVFPITMLAQDIHLPISGICLVLLLGTIARRIRWVRMQPQPVAQRPPARAGGSGVA
jgi:Glycosyltransferase family 87